MPPALQKLMSSREVKKMKSTFCVWTEDGTTWHCNPMDGEDASMDLLSTIDGNPLSYAEYGKWFYPANLPLEAVRQLADGVPAVSYTHLPESSEEFVIFDGGRHGYDNMFCDEHDPSELEHRPLKRYEIPASKLVLELGYSIDYEDCLLYTSRCV